MVTIKKLISKNNKYDDYSPVLIGDEYSGKASTLKIGKSFRVGEYDGDNSHCIITSTVIKYYIRSDKLKHLIKDYKSYDLFIETLNSIYGIKGSVVIDE